MGVVGASYNGLVFMINNRLTWYRTQIDNCQQTITSCGWQIGSLENDIRYAEDELRRNELLETSENG